MTTIVDAAGQFLTGCQHIERAIKSGLEKGGRRVPSQAFHWDRPMVPVPKVGITLGVRLGRQRASEFFSREEVVDSHAGLARPDVRAKVRTLVERLTPGP